MLFVGNDLVLYIVSANKASAAIGDYEAVATELTVATDLFIDNSGGTAEIV